uniref:RING-type domain-containing protein n=1 Tax=Ananas comosus var. bracteatus TaxID=296719 RepID=A0A6V7P3A4_ANACO|nr:unnamed protein product [Ananas comosus var. bracteatus]
MHFWCLSSNPEEIELSKRHTPLLINSTPPTPPSPTTRISPAVLFIIVILTIIFFVSGLLHLIVRILIKKNANTGSRNRPTTHQETEVSGSDALQRQLRQLFHLHDSGLDQTFIDSLPVFLYKEILGPKEPFDCAVCLCEFAEDDKLRLLPVCGTRFISVASTRGFYPIPAAPLQGGAI